MATLMTLAVYEKEMHMRCRSIGQRNTERTLHKRDSYLTSTTAATISRRLSDVQEMRAIGYRYPSGSRSSQNLSHPISSLSPLSIYAYLFAQL